MRNLNKCKTNDLITIPLLYVRRQLSWGYCTIRTTDTLSIAASYCIGAKSTLFALVYQFQSCIGVDLETILYSNNRGGT